MAGSILKEWASKLDGLEFKSDLSTDLLMGHTASDDSVSFSPPISKVGTTLPELQCCQKVE